MKQVPHGMSPYDSNPDVEEILEQVDAYIVDQVEKIISRNPYIARPELLDLEKAELAQKVRINLWHALQEKSIKNLKAYISRIVHNELVNIVRGREPPLPLPMFEDGELREGDILIIPGEGMATPEFEIEQKEIVAACAEKVAAAISTLPPRQKNAMECSLYEQWDDFQQFKDTFKLHGVNVEETQWPAGRAEKHLLKASISAARRSIARCMNVDLALYKQKGASYFSSRMR